MSSFCNGILRTQKSLLILLLAAKKPGNLEDPDNNLGEPDIQIRLNPDLSFRSPVSSIFESSSPTKSLEMGAGCMLGLNNPFPAPGADDIRRQFGLGPPLFLLREEAP